MMSNSELYKTFYDTYQKRYPEKTGTKCQNDANDIWRKAKSGKNYQEFKSVVEEKIQTWKREISQRKMTAMSQFFFSGKKGANSAESPNNAKNSERFTNVENPKPKDSPLVLSTSRETDSESTQSHDTPAQTKLKAEICQTEKQINRLILAKNAGLGSRNDQKEIENLTKLLKKQTQSLKIKRLNAKYQKKHRESLKRKLETIKSDNSKLLRSKKQAGRPRIENEQPGLLQAIVEIAMFGSAAHERRQMEEIKSCKTLADLQKKIEEKGFKISKSALYLRLQPRKSATNEGKRHVVTVPVKLCKAKNELHKDHPDGKFCTSVIRDLESLASMLGPDQVVFLSQDDKARVPIGMTAAQKQSPMIMHMEYRVKLPDHDWVIGEKHKLIPSVYAGIVIKPNGLGYPDAVTYSGPTYVAIRSGKHSSSTAASHSIDFERLLELDSFENLMKFGGATKPIIIFTVDGGPDENPRYPKTIAYAIKHFKDHDLDALFIATNAPGRSAYNRVERRMAPLSKQLSGVILPHDTYGTHLDHNNKTVDVELEKKNFAKAGQVLSEIWSQIVLDNHPVMAEYVLSDNDVEVPSIDDMIWYQAHVRESQYFLQIVKCADISCCRMPRSDLRKFLPDGFLPPPLPLTQQDGHLTVPPPNVSEVKFLPLFQRLSANFPIPHLKYDKMPHDYFCTTIQTQLDGRICKDCSLYFASKKAANLHAKILNHNLRSKLNRKKSLKILKKRKDETLCAFKDSSDNDAVEWIENSDDIIGDIDTSNFPENEDGNSSFPIIDSIENWLTNEWNDN